mmetsp:Transcript_22534/g.53186  ORF Transcript_22534/g.53186 Transcript_22534/m.53186 type:complete len:511 (+) Transcript_22534:141-1673(+)
MPRTCSKTLAALLLLLVALASAIRTPESFPQHSLRQQSSQLRQRKQHAAAAVVESTPRGGKVDAAPASSKPAILDDAVTGTVVLTIIERIVNKFFVNAGIKFPAQLGGCGILFAFLVLADAIAPGKGNAMFEYLTPGTTLLTKWLPVFFVPGLAMLPLAPSVGSGMEVAKVLLVTGLGFVYTLYSVAFTVLFLRKLDGKIAPPAPAQATKKSTPVASGPPAKPFSEEAMSFLFKTSVVTGIGSLLTEKFMSDAVWGTPLKATFFFAATFASYVGCARLPAAFVKAVHPLLTSTFVVWGLLGAYGAATGASFVDSVKTYKTSSLAWNAAGAGDLLLFCLGPSVVSFAVSMYSRKKIMLENFKIVVAAIMVSSLGALFGTAAFTNLIRLGGSSGNALMIRLSMLARNITTALAIPVTQMLGGDIAIAVVVVVLTGIIGAQYGRKLLDLVNIQDPITRGLAVGSAAQGLGVSSMVPEVDAFPFAAMAMALTAVAGTIFVAIPEVKDAVVSFCG